jgi:hypothetical protein
LTPLSRLWARATASRIAFDRSAPQPAFARSALTSRSTSASALFRPPVAGGAGLLLGLGVGFVVGLLLGFTRG